MNGTIFPVLWVMRRLLETLSLGIFLSGSVGLAEEDVAGNDQVSKIVETFGGRGALADSTPPTAPTNVLQSFEVRSGFEIELVSSEPEIAQPLFATWDSKGRLWVVQYLQYQFPAGLKIVRYDQHLRAVFDRVPEPPPHGPVGADKITVLEDVDGDGRFDSAKDVITGLNIATSVQVGRGGVWVLQPPYLLFYPDENGDDVPDSDPEVALSGFGLEDTHSVANSLTWGPDGWLYGANGSTTTGSVSSAVTKNVRFQGQCIWRYNPDSTVFEIYAEGGGNTFSLDIDSRGRVFSGTNNGSTRGMYYPQGSYGKKGWGKHGPLTNPYAFGYFQHMRHEGDKRRFAQAFAIYEGGLFPESYAGSIIAPNSLHNTVWLSEKRRDTSTYRTIDETPLVTSTDRWFRPVWTGIGPDGCAYILDWYDTRLSHVRPIDDWHKESGRIYRIQPEGTEIAGRNIAVQGSPKELLELTRHPNRRVRQRAVLELRWRDDLSASELQQLLKDLRDDRPNALELLWILDGVGELSLSRASELLSHPSADVRRWVIRILGDRGESITGLTELARLEPDVQVRSQLASAAKRFSAKAGVPIVGQLLRRSEDLDDLHMPLMNWWAMEAHAESGRDEVLGMLGNSEVWQLPMVRKHIASRLMQRYLMAGGDENLATAVKLLDLAPDDEVRGELMAGLNRALQGVPIPSLPEPLTSALEAHRRAMGSSPLLLRLQTGDEDALKSALKAVAQSGVSIVERLELAKALGETENVKVLDTLLRLVRDDSEHALQRVAMRAAARFEDEKVAKTILAAYNSRISNQHDVRGTANRVLVSRESWARLFLAEIDRWYIRADEIQPDVVQQLRLFQASDIATLVTKHFGATDGVSSPAKIAEIARLKTVLVGKSGNADKGRVLYEQRCAACHQLFGEGGVVGPELTGYERGNLDFWLAATVDPSLEIREEFQTYVLNLKDGRTLSGMLEKQGPTSVTLRDAASQSTVIGRESIDELQAIPVSLMPEGLLHGLTDEQLVDLLSYLTLTSP